MRVLLVTHYYPPEIGAPQSRLHHLARHLTAHGHETTVLTGFPNYPTGVVPPYYRGRVLMREELDGVRVLRTWIYPTENSGVGRRLLNHLSFAISATMSSLLVGGIDVVVVESPPLFVAAAGPIIALIKRAKFVINIADLWPEAPVAMGILTGSTVIRLAEFLAAAILVTSDHIVAVPPAIREYLVRGEARTTSKDQLPSEFSRRECIRKRG